MSNNYGSIGIGTMIIFIAMVLVAGIAASVMIQTMNNLQNEANRTGSETVREISTGIEIRQVSGYVINSKIDQIALYISPIVASGGIDLSHTVIFLSDSNNEVMLKYDSRVFSSHVSSNGLFHTLNSSNLTSSSFGIVVIRDRDNSCTASNPVINERDMVALIVNTTKCFSGLSPRTEVWGKVTPEYGISGIISFTVPSVLIERVVDLQP